MESNKKSNTPIIVGVVIVLAIITAYITSLESFQNTFNPNSCSGISNRCGVGQI